MPIVFSSKAAADVLMLNAHAQALLDALGKDPQAAQGIWTVAELPAAIGQLQAAAQAKDAQSAAQVTAAADDDAGRSGQEQAPEPTWAARAYPLLHMLQAAQAQQQPVIWQRQA